MTRVPAKPPSDDGAHQQVEAAIGQLVRLLAAQAVRELGRNASDQKEAHQDATDQSED
ncbi:MULTISPECIES: hypothetical protein [unclassified Ruegeria]|uniref:hypothetical protein n=1 Tax=unclassified Ruegeria TaxID=2625375 RepID=UPI001AE67DD0|nr:MULTISPECIES: hypothetical protein [unclassified Ruegeria]